MMNHKELMDYVIRNANYLETDSFGFAHYRRPDYLVAREYGLEFDASPKLARLRGTIVLVNKWILRNIEDTPELEAIQAELAQTFGAPTFSDLIENWHSYVNKYRCEQDQANQIIEEQLSLSDQQAAMINEGTLPGGPWFRNRHTGFNQAAHSARSVSEKRYDCGRPNCALEDIAALVAKYTTKESK